MTLRIVLLLSLFCQTALGVQSTPVNLHSSYKKLENMIEQLRRVDQKTRSKSEKGLLQLGMGVRHYELGNYEKSLDFLVKSLDVESELKNYSYYYLGLTYKAQKKPKEAKKYFLKITYDEINRHLKYFVFLELAKIEIAQKNWNKAYRHLRYLEKRLRRDKKHAKILELLAYVDKKKNRSWRSCRWARSLYRKYPDSPLSKKWDRGLEKANIRGVDLNCTARFSDQKSRIQRLQLIGKSQRARQEVERIRDQYGRGSYKGDILQVEYLNQEGHPKEAFELLLSHYEEKKDDQKYLKKLAKTSLRLGDPELGISIYYQIYKNFPKKRKGKEALYKSAFTSYQYGDYDGSIRKFLEYTKLYSRSALFNNHARWYIAWMSYLKGQNQLSYKLLSQILKNKKKKPRYWRSYSKDKIRYWLAMSADKAGKSKIAKDIFRDLAENGLLSYYAVLAKTRLESLGGDFKSNLKDASKSRSLFNEPPWIDQLASKEMTESKKRVLTKDKRSSGFFRRARSLKKIGLYNWAKWELYEIERKTKDKAILKTLMTEYHDIGAFHRSSYIGQVYFQDLFKKEVVSRKSLLWDYTYPKAYNYEVERASGAHGVDEEFVWAIMRAESKYRSQAISPVGARGLMQVMPYTGRKIANILDVPFSPEDLFHPKKGVYLGTSYLKRLMGKFKKTVPLAAAAYNAGPHRVVRWAHYFGNGLELDEFVEHIPFVETRNYVKKVVLNYNIYSFLDKSKSMLKLAKSFNLPPETYLPVRENWDRL